ncbi:VirK/YbjX family protein [Ideonella livida]|uniref:DUF535 domain-containing protein n=1 Tax=Ideonella livida TaxID=2707176 RepID=A0A7C9PEN6_9BURK|nr:DUF535 family protein [Ideonella livida]NDY89996.1 DUF535 domain-containing protein [Ideonella livida]
MAESEQWNHAGGWVQGMRFICRALGAVHRGQGVTVWVRRVRLMVASARKVHLWRPLAQAKSGPLAELATARPEVLGMLEWPYQHCGWSVEERFRAFYGHYRELQHLAWLRVPLGCRWVLARLDDVYPDLSVQLDRPIWLFREGELSLNLFVGDLRAYTLAFSFDRDERGRRVSRVGGIQGRSVEGAAELYAGLTQALHGCRPRDFMVALLQFICEGAQVEQILAVSDASRHHLHPYFGAGAAKDRSSVYDEIWTDRGGVRGDDGFFRLPARHVARDLAEVPAKKRAQYRRRYALLARLQADIRDIGQLGQPCPDVVTTPAT